MLFNEPKLLKWSDTEVEQGDFCGFSALQRAEIAEMRSASIPPRAGAVRFSALQRAEIAEMVDASAEQGDFCGFSALQRAEIAEIQRDGFDLARQCEVSVLFNEPKLLKYLLRDPAAPLGLRVSVLFNEPKLLKLR